MVKLAKISLSLAGSASLHLADPRLVFITGAGPDVVRTAVPGFSSKTNTLFAWDEEYNLDTQDNQSLQIVLEGSAAEFGSGMARAQCVQWAKGTQAKSQRLELPRGYKVASGQSARAVGQVELGSSSNASKPCEVELSDPQTGKSVGSITFFLLPGSKNDEQSLEPQIAAQQANGQALRSAPDQPLHPTMQRVREVFNAYTEEAMQSAPFVNREDNLDILDTGESVRSRQRDDEVVERRFFYVLEDRPLLMERTSRFVEKTWVEKEYVREAHLVAEHQLPGHTEALEAPQLLRKDGMTALPDKPEMSRNEAKAPGSSDHGLQEKGMQSAATAGASDAQVNGVQSPAKASMVPRSNSSSSSSSQEGAVNKKHRHKDHSTKCTPGWGWFKKRLRGKKSLRGKNHELVPSQATPYQLTNAAEATAQPAGAATRHVNTAGATHPPEIAVGRDEAAAAQAGQSLGSSRGGVILPVTLKSTGDLDSTRSNIVRGPASGATGHKSETGIAERTDFDRMRTQGSKHGKHAGQNSDGLGAEGGFRGSGVHGDSTKLAPPLAAVNVEDQGMGVRSAGKGVDDVAADMNAAMQIAMLGVVGQEGPANHVTDNVSDKSLVQSPGTGLGAGQAKGPDNPAPLRSYFTVIEERRVFKERKERFIKHQIFECEYVFEVRYAGERSMKSQHLPARELLSREVHVLA